MRTTDYLQSLSAETQVLKNRVRYLIEDNHWQTDGEWKESVVRQVLRRHLPASVIVGRGFVVSAEDRSHQIDVLIFDSSMPVLFRDGDLAIVTPDAVVGMVEVKSRANPGIIAEAAGKCADDIAFVRRHLNSKAFAAIFAFESGEARPEAYLAAIRDASPEKQQRLDFVCLGDSRFIKYWDLDPAKGNRFYETWYSYQLPEMAPGYFFHNVIDAVSPRSVLQNNDVWFPRQGKELHVEGTIECAWPKQGAASGVARTKRKRAIVGGK
jgi:hypothetical protein